jgi:hypothetical protein
MSEETLETPRMGAGTAMFGIVTTLASLWSLFNYNEFPLLWRFLISLGMCIFFVLAMIQGQKVGFFLIFPIIGLLTNGYRMLNSPTGPMASNAEYDYIKSLGPNVQVLKPIETTPADDHSFHADFKYGDDCAAVPEPSCQLSQAKLDELLDTTSKDGSSVRKHTCGICRRDESTVCYVNVIVSGDGKFSTDGKWGTSITLNVPIVRQ